ncbi:hypothetical protein CYMTET_25531, partial [Cymbomonas tetramitiformis]
QFEGSVKQTCKDESGDATFDILLCHLPESFLYQIPPARTSAGHRAADWNIEKPPLKTVSIRIVEACNSTSSEGEKCSVRLEDQTTGELFAACPVYVDKPLISAVEPVLDSSRYFAIRVEEEGKGGQHAYVGIGFAERHSASEFQATLQDYYRRAERGRQAERNRAEEQCGDEASTGPTVPKVDMAFKPGESIRLSLKGGSNEASSNASRKLVPSLVPGTPFALVPPPSHGAPTKQVTLMADQKNGGALPSVNDGNDDDDDDFGDFVSG